MSKNPSLSSPDTPQSTAESGTTRRRFLQTAAGAALAPLILPSGVLAYDGRPGANDRIVTGHIGLGGISERHLLGLQDHVGAICDVDTDRIADRLSLVKRKVPVYTDYRRLLENPDIDAVVIGTPDHWHGLMAIQACEAGKDVYVEKPAAKTIAEGRAMVEAAARYERVVQVGSQGRNHVGAVAVRDFIQAGNIGHVTRVECWHNDNPVGGDPSRGGKPPANLDWDLWLGPAASRQYNPDYCHRNFRWVLDLGGGQIRDRGAHVFNLVSWILGLDRTGPKRATATGQRPETGLWNCPINFTVTYEYEEPDLTIRWSQPGEPAGDFEFGAVYHGTRGKTVVLGGDGRVFPDEQVKEFCRDRNQAYAFPEGLRARDLHHANFIECLRSRETPIMDIESGHRVASMCILANLAYRAERTLEWDPITEQFVDDPAANSMLGTPGRREFHL